MAGLYIHIPFCKQRCNYCAFYSSTLYNMREEYVAALTKELLLRKDYAHGKAIETIYFGGGTPSTLGIEQLQRICSTIYSAYPVTNSPEVTIECNPDDLTPEFLEALRPLPFNRISMGVQSFNDAQLQRLGRRHTAEGARTAVGNARKAGYTNISIDLMFALPGSTPQQWQEDLDSAIALRPQHLSAYNLMYEEGTPLYSALCNGGITELSEEENLEQFRMLIESMKKAGYRHYEISNFALPGYEAKHNSAYWRHIPYSGFGPGAHSFSRGRERHPLHWLWSSRTLLQRHRARVEHCRYKRVYKRDRERQPQIRNRAPERRRALQRHNTHPPAHSRRAAA